MQSTLKLRTCGTDPGFASLGIAIIERDIADIKLVNVRVVETKKGDKKAMRDLRVAADDQRRLREFWDAVSATITEHKPMALGVESYAPWPGQMGGSAWKVAFAMQMVVCCGWHHNLRPLIFRPDDLKRRLLGKNSGTKGEIETALCAKISGMREALDKIPKTKREHAADAIGHAYLAMGEVETMRATYGVNF